VSVNLVAPLVAHDAPYKMTLSAARRRRYATVGVSLTFLCLFCPDSRVTTSWPYHCATAVHRRHRTGCTSSSSSAEDCVQKVVPQSTGVAGFTSTESVHLELYVAAFRQRLNPELHRCTQRPGPRTSQVGVRTTKLHNDIVARSEIVWDTVVH
jgi:hypothetical protein